MPSNSPWYSANKTVPALLGLICVLIGGIYLAVRSDINEIKADLKESAKQITDTRIEVVKSVGALREQSAASNTRLESILEELKRPRR